MPHCNGDSAALRAVGKPAEQVRGRPAANSSTDPEGARALMENDRRVMEDRS